MQNIVEAIKPVNIAEIGEVELFKLIREASKRQNHKGQIETIGLAHSVMVARALKEAYRLGEIRGRALK